MPMPSLKPLIDAANLAYQQIREPKEASYLHQLATFGATLGGHKDTSGNKKTALAQLAEIELAGTTEKQNETLSNKLGTLLAYSKDGTNFKALVEILMRCSMLASYPRTASTAAMQFGLLPFLITLHSELKNPEHVLFQELSVFFTGIEMFAKEQLQAETLARANQENQTLQEKQRLAFQTKESFLTLKLRTLEPQLREKTSQLETKTKALEESREQHAQTLDELEKSKASLATTTTQLKDLLQSRFLDLENTQSEVQKLKKKVALLEADIENGCADHIATHLKLKDTQLKAVKEELELVKSQLEHLKRSKIPNEFASTYNRHGVYGANTLPNISINNKLSNPTQLRPVAGLRNNK